MQILLVVGGSATALIAVISLTKMMWSMWRRVDSFLADWFGEPARPGWAARPSMPERVTALEADLAHVKEQVTPNGGHSALLADRIVRIEDKLSKDE